jgi:hypothetical protein
VCKCVCMQSACRFVYQIILGPTGAPLAADVAADAAALPSHEQTAPWAQYAETTPSTLDATSATVRLYTAYYCTQ